MAVEVSVSGCGIVTHALLAALPGPDSVVAVAGQAVSSALDVHCESLGERDHSSEHPYPRYSLLLLYIYGILAPNRYSRRDPFYLKNNVAVTMAVADQVCPQDTFATYMRKPDTQTSSCGQ